MKKCDRCGGPTIPGFLVNSFYCVNECDLKSANKENSTYVYTWFTYRPCHLPVDHKGHCLSLYGRWEIVETKDK